MIDLILSESAGFCFGVKRAVEELVAYQDQTNSQQIVYTLGPIIHNPQVVDELKSKKIEPIDFEQIDQIKPKVVAIRSHGVPRSVYEELKNQKIKTLDLTCPFVKNVHKKVEFLEKNNYEVIIIGQKNHPEVQGIIGYCKKDPLVVNSVDQIQPEKIQSKVGIVSQTTILLENFKKIIAEISSFAKEILCYNTICSATEIRQNDAKMIAKNVDKMIVIGGKMSSNSNKLKDICKELLKEVYFIETYHELNKENFHDGETVGVTGGASTPASAIDDVISFFKNHFPVNIQTFKP